MAKDISHIENSLYYYLMDPQQIITTYQRSTIIKTKRKHAISTAQ